MSISSRDNRIKRICFDAMMIALAMMLSYLEVLLPLQATVALPGFRLGLANLVVVLVFCFYSPIDAAVVSFLRIFLMGLLFGSVTSLYFSVMGGLFSFLALCVFSRLGARVSYIGCSVFCAAAHNCGQTVAAVTLFGSEILFSYLPLLLVASVIYGGIVGILLNLCAPKLAHLFGRITA